MRAQSSNALRRASKWFAIACCAGVFAIDIYMGSPGDPGWWALVLPFLAWIAGPILLAAGCASISRTLVGQLIFLLLAVAFAFLTAWTYVAVLRSTNSTAPIALIFAPLYLYAAWLVVFVLAALFGWRIRDRPNPPPP